MSKPSRIYWFAFRLFSFLTVSLIAAAAARATTIHVTTTVQGDSRGTGPNGAVQCSLAEAIFAANTHTNQALDVSVNLYTSGCETGTGNDTIVLPANAVFQMSDFVHAIQHSRYGPTATPVIFSNITIQGNGATIQAATGAPNMRAFTVGFDQVDLPSGAISGWGNLTLQNVTIQGFVVKGGDGGGGGGGGGGMGAGGAIFVDGSGSSNAGLTISNSTFTGNGAVGGNGDDDPLGGGGSGGGGLSSRGGFGTSNNGGSGGGGSFGNGGNGSETGFSSGEGGGGGGGGGGTDSSGQNADASGHGAGPGFCGGFGGGGGLITTLGDGDNGSDAPCPGGGGGGGGASAGLLNGGHGGNGAYGGGGGGAGTQFNNGGDGGFGGGGGGASDERFGCLGHPHGGKGGFGGGGGGANPASSPCSEGGVGGRFGGDGRVAGGGGGAALGGAIFSDTSTVLIQDSTFFNNFVTRGLGGQSHPPGVGNADNGSDAGGAIFARNGSLTVQDVTISGNQGTGSGAGIVVINDGSATSFTLENTIIANNGAQECFFEGSVTAEGAGNLIMSNGSGTAPFSACPNVVSTADPMLAALTLNPPGNTPTMALQAGSPAINAADPGTSLPTDQRGLGRKGTPDIGAYETGLVTTTTLTSSSNPSTYGSSVTFTGTVTNTSTAATPTSTLAITIDGSSVAATVASSGNTITATYSTQTLSAGPHTVVATYTNTGNFLPSGPASLTQTVTQAKLVIRANDASRVVDAPNPPFSATYTGFVNGDTPASLSGTLTCTTTANQFSPAGNYPITCSGQTSTNYAITYVPGTLTITATEGSVGNLIGDIFTGGCIDNSGIVSALTSKLAAAQAAISAGNIQTAINILTALKNQLSALASKHIATSCTIGGVTFNPVTVLLLDVQGLIDSLRTSTIADPITGSVVNASGVGVPGATLSILDAGGNTVAVASTDITGFYFFATTGVLVPSSSYTVAVTGLPAGFVSSTPAASPAFIWTGTGIMIGNFVLN